jgi:hypothetical protein
MCRSDNNRIEKIGRNRKKLRLNSRYFIKYLKTHFYIQLFTKEKLLPLSWTFEHFLQLFSIIFCSFIAWWIYTRIHRRGVLGEITPPLWFQNARVWLHTHKSDFYTQCVILHAEWDFNIHEWNFATYECDVYTQSVISTQKRFFSTCKVRFSHAECDFTRIVCFLHTRE